MQNKSFRLCIRGSLITRASLSSDFPKRLCCRSFWYIGILYLQAPVLAAETAEKANSLSAAEISAGFELILMAVI